MRYYLIYAAIAILFLQGGFAYWNLGSGNDVIKSDVKELSDQLDRDVVDIKSDLDVQRSRLLELEHFTYEERLNRERAALGKYLGGDALPYLEFMWMDYRYEHPRSEWFVRGACSMNSHACETWYVTTVGQDVFLFDR